MNEKRFPNEFEINLKEKNRKIIGKRAEIQKFSTSHRIHWGTRGWPASSRLTIFAQRG